MIHLDTTFLVDLLREARRGEVGPATRFLDSLAAEELWISVHAACELYAGVELSRHSDHEREGVRTLIAELRVVYPDERFPAIYGKLLAELERRGERIGLMDLLIATAAVVAGAPLVTRNRKHFTRISELKVLSY